MDPWFLVFMVYTPGLPYESLMATNPFLGALHKLLVGGFMWTTVKINAIHGTGTPTAPGTRKLIGLRPIA